MGAGLHPHHPLAGTGLEVEIHRPEVFDAGLGQPGHHVGGSIDVVAYALGDLLRLVGAPLAEDASVVHLEEPQKGPGQSRVGVDGPAGRAEGVVAARQVEQVPGDDEDAGSVPGVEGLGEFAGQCQRRGSGRRGEQQVADHHDPSAERDVDPGPARLGDEGARLGVVSRPAIALPGRSSSAESSSSVWVVVVTATTV